MELFATYREAGIFAVLRSLMRSAGGEHWQLYFKLDSDRYSVIEFSEATFTLKNGHDAAYSAIEHGQPLFARDQEAALIVAKALSKEDLELIAYAVSLLMTVEATGSAEYPSLLPFFLPFGGELSGHNRLILKPRRVYFLAGAPGSGKKTFIRNHFLFNKQRLLGSPELDSAEGLIEIGESVIVPELAKLGDDDLVRLQSSLVSPRISSLFFLSIYDLTALYDRKIISSEIFQACNENRLIMPSFRNRKDSEADILTPMFLLKGLAPQLTKKRINYKDALAEGSKSTGVNPGGKKLRDAVQELEIQAITLAHRAVGNSQNKIAKYLGISRGSLQHKIKKYNLPYGDWDLG